ncbi:hypothetical protein B0H13DRAFT_2654700 [Mycena leptocephala]|nr:hypothetical protein B0H13DRAFT_2654700 [Mycena leptocephala]
MFSANTTAPLPCGLKCTSANSNVDLTSCNPSDSACLCISEVFLRAVAECVLNVCPDDLPNANAFIASYCAMATASLLDPRQLQNTTVVSFNGTTSQPIATASAPSQKANTAAIAGGTVGGLLIVAPIIAITILCMRARSRSRIERMEEKQKKPVVVDPDPELRARAERVAQEAEIIVELPPNHTTV